MSWCVRMCVGAVRCGTVRYEEWYQIEWRALGYGCDGCYLAQKPKQLRCDGMAERQSDAHLERPGSRTTQNDPTESLCLQSPPSSSTFNTRRTTKDSGVVLVSPNGHTMGAKWAEDEVSCRFNLTVAQRQNSSKPLKQRMKRQK